MIHPSDGRTDGRAIAYTRYSIYAVARKNVTLLYGVFTAQRYTVRKVLSLCLSVCRYCVEMSKRIVDILPPHAKKVKGRTLDIAPQVDIATTKALRYMARTKQRRTYLPYTFPAIAGTHLPTPRGWRVE